MLNKIGLLAFSLAVMLFLEIGFVVHASEKNAETVQGDPEQNETALLPLEGDTGVTAELEETYEKRESFFGRPWGVLLLFTEFFSFMRHRFILDQNFPLHDIL